MNGGQLFESGTATIGSVMGVVKDRTKNWMPGQWEGYSITDLDAPHPFNGSVITANTSTTITYERNDEPDVPGGQWHNIRPGHRYEIHKIDIALDQGGMGKGDLIRDVNINGVLVPKNTTCNCNQWPHQQSEPLFEWNNTNYDGSPSVWSAVIDWNPSEHQGRDYFDLGINIPAGTIPAQVTSAYPASVNGGSAYTQDFIYPHPLQGAGNPTQLPHLPQQQCLNVHNDDRFEAQTADGGSGVQPQCGTFVTIEPSLPPNIIQFNDTALAARHWYCYRVRAISGGSNSTWSNSVSVRIRPH